MSALRLFDYLRLVKFSHSVFALPFALSSAWLVDRKMPDPGVLALIVLCCVAARTAAMGFNRLVDRELDRANPRTADRELPSGKLRTSAVGMLVLISSAVFIAGAAQLSPLCGWLALPVLGVLLGYSYAKRFTWASHLVLGASLGLAPLGAWLAVQGDKPGGSLLVPLLLAAAVISWVAGFDLIYSCQDATHDAKVGLRSIPARFGVARALHLARALHVLTVALLLCFGVQAELDWIWLVALAGAALLLIFEHRLVAPDDLSRVNLAFFTLNGWVGIGLFLGLALDLALLSGPSA